MKMLNANGILDIAASRYGEQLYWHIRRIVVSREDAEDAMQETFLKIYTKASSFRGDENAIAAWVYKIATREALQVLRKRRTGLFQDIDTVGEELSSLLATECAPDADKSSILFQKATLTLSTKQRIAFMLRYYDDLSYAQIAEITGSSEGTLRTNYHLAVDKIKEYLTEHAI